MPAGLHHELDHFRYEIHMQMQRAAAWGATAVVINARELHSAFGDFLGLNTSLDAAM
jgi:hypothetical protein